ncbi:MAG TPA: hypothetical protein P5549_07650 [Syntrophomonas sp.]|nr:hypothetical protein [Syntrophomonas sp.]
MRKHIPIVFLSLFLCLLLCPVALAAVDWQIDWQENGAVQEKVLVSGQELVHTETQWQKSSSDNQVTYSRSVENWQTYNNLADKIPVQAKVKDLFCCKIITLTALPEIQPNTLYAALKQNDVMRLQMNVPGFILDSSGTFGDNNIVGWEIDQPGQVFEQDFFFRAIMIDGLGLGIVILSFGVIVLAIFFAVRMRKVNRLIDETYSLDNVVIDDEEEEQQS